MTLQGPVAHRWATWGWSVSLWVLASFASAGCLVPAQMFASSSDLSDYRAFRIAPREGVRLALAQAYLERHPRGRWADEVKLAFETEEDAWFEAAKASRSRALDYVIELPNGPHIEAARSLLVLFDQHESDLDMLELMTAWRRTNVLLDLESERRRRVGEVVLEDVGALLDASTPGADLDSPPEVLAMVLRGSIAKTWGTAAPGIREDEVYFVLPTTSGTQARVAEVRLVLSVRRQRVVGGLIEGEDLFVRWTEANDVRVLDASSAPDRALAAASIGDILAGALEARLPAARCATRPGDREILSRVCDGWAASVRMGERPGDHDVIWVRGPAK